MRGLETQRGRRRIRVHSSSSVGDGAGGGWSGLVMTVRAVRRSSSLSRGSTDSSLVTDACLQGAAGLTNITETQREGGGKQNGAA